MVEYTAFLVLFAIFLLIYGLSKFLPLEKYGLEAGPVYILYKTERFNSFLKRIAEKNRRFWRIYGNIGIVVALVAMFLAIYFLFTNLRSFLYAPTEAEPIVPMLPGITVGVRWVPYLLVAVGIAITTHEMAHGIMAFLENIPVKSSGLILAPITIGGFVEPDDEVFDKAELKSKLRVMAAGSLTNMVTGVLTLLLLMGLFAPFSGVLVMTVPDDGPAYASGMRPWEVIHSIGGYRVRDLADLYQILAGVGPGVTLVVETSSSVRTIVTAAAPENGSRGILGVRDLINYNQMRVGEANPQLSYHLNVTLEWLSLIMTNVAIFNMLPLYPFDGEGYIYAILKKLKRGAKWGRITINVFSLFLLASNILLSLVRYGLRPF